MEVQTLAASICAAAYGVSAATLTPLSSSPGAISHSFLVTRPAGAAWVLHAYRAAWAEVVAPQESVAVHVAGVAALLDFFGRQDYPAPRLVRAIDGAATIQRDEWHALMTTYIIGEPVAYDLDSLRGLGTAVGKLHRLTPPSAIVDSWWDLEHVAPLTLARLVAGRAAVPPDWQGWYAACRRRLEAALAWTDLPCTIIHADAWVGNALATAPGQLTLIDWECAGCGPAILDLGSLILHAHYDLPGYLPNRDRLNALLSGYCAQRQPTAAELALLPQAIQFGPVFRSALFFFRAEQRGWGEWVERHLTRERERFAPGVALAGEAQAMIQQLLATG